MFVERLVVHVVLFQIVVEPLRDAGDAGFVRHHDFDGAVQNLLRVEVVLAIINSAAMSTGVHVSLSVLVSSVCQ